MTWDRVVNLQGKIGRSMSLDSVDERVPEQEFKGLIIDYSLMEHLMNLLL